MQVLVPEYAYFFPHENPRGLSYQLVEIQQSKLPDVTKAWSDLNEDAKNPLKSPDVGAVIRRPIGNTVPYQEETSRSIFRRLGATAHLGARLGAPHCRDIFIEVAKDLGRHIACNGFNLLYGGGADGLMGKVLEGYNQGIRDFGRRPDQYSIQVVPAAFTTKDIPTLNGLKPPNECLCDKSDVAIIMPVFEQRRYVLNSRCEVGFSCPGGKGTFNEWTDLAVKIKIGLSNAYLYGINPYVPKLGHRFYDNWLKQMDDMEECGLQDPSESERFPFMNSVGEAFSDLMGKLQLRNRTPDEHYALHCERDRKEEKIRADIIGVIEEITPTCSRCIKGHAHPGLRAAL